LVDLWNKATAMFKDAELRTTLTGETATTRMGERMQKKSQEAGGKTAIEDVTVYEKNKMADWDRLADQLVAEDYATAVEMAKGNINAPPGIPAARIEGAVANRAAATGDAKLLDELALTSSVNRRLSQAGQEIKAADFGWGDILDNPVEVIREVGKKRVEKTEKTTGKKTESNTGSVAELTKKLEETEARLAEAESKAGVGGFIEDVVSSENGVGDVIKPKKKTPGVTEPKEPITLESIVEKIHEKAAKENPLDGINAPIQQLARHFVEQGVKKPGELVDAVHSVIVDIIPKITKRDVADAVSGYGKYKLLSKDEVSVILRDLKGQLQQIAKLEDMARGMAPKKTGIERRTPTDAERALQKLVNEEKKKGGYDIVDPATQLKSALDAVKTRLTNEIKDLESQIAKRERIVKDKTTLKYDAEAEALRARRNELKSEFDEIFGKPGITPEQQMSRAMGAVQKSIDEYTRRINEKDIGPREKKPELHSPELDKLRADRERLKADYQQMVDDMNPRKTPAEIALQSLKTRLAKQISEMEQELATRQKIVKQKTGVADDAESLKLKVRVEELKKQQEDVFGKKGMSLEQKIAMAERATEKSIEELTRRINENDLSSKPKGIPLRSAKLDKLREDRKALQNKLQELRDIANPKKTPDEIALQSAKTRLENEIAKYEKELAEGQFVDKHPRKSSNHPDVVKLRRERDLVKKNREAAANRPGGVTPEEIQNIMTLSNEMKRAREAMEQGGDRFTYGAARVAYENYVDGLTTEHSVVQALKNRGQQFKQEYKENKGAAIGSYMSDVFTETVNTSIAMTATLDNSFIGRQGLKTLYTHPTVWADAAKNSFKDIAKELGGERALDALKADVYSRPNYLNGNYELAKILPKVEEQFPTSLPGKAPGIGRVFKASEAAFVGTGMRMRTGLFDLLSDQYAKSGVDMTVAKNVEGLGRVINSLTARGRWGKGVESEVVRWVLWAPKMIKGNWDVLTAHAGQDIPAFAKQNARMNLIKIVGVTGTTLAIADALHPGSVEWDSTSSDFGKIVIGDTRIDITGGAAQYIILAARMISGESKNSSTGITNEFGTGYGDSNRFNAGVEFMVNKATPPARVGIDKMRGYMFGGKKFTPGGAAYHAFTPISIQEALDLPSPTSIPAVAGVGMNVLGINTNTYPPQSRDWELGDAEIVNRFKSVVDDETFKAANKASDEIVSQYIRGLKKGREIPPEKIEEYIKQITPHIKLPAGRNAAWVEAYISGLQISPDYEKATDDQKRNHLSKIKKNIRGGVMGEYKEKYDQRKQP